MNNSITDWSSLQTAQWWVEKDRQYERHGHNQPSLDYMLTEAIDFKSILEVGSGTGRLINRLSKGRKAGAADINPYLLRCIEKHIEVYEIDITQSPVNTPYELVYTYQVLQHFDHYDLMKAIKHIKQIATKEIWLMEGYLPNTADGEMTHPTGSYVHRYERYLDCYQIDSLDQGKILIYRSKL